MNITVYTQDNCPPCQYIKNYFREHQILFTEKNIRNSQYRSEMMEMEAFSTPLIMIDDEILHAIDMDRIEALVHV
ncbi:glutaredoxin family protein [Macrococcus carouselicus]|nr:glutaredoxin family protein [Macrococcus carouselicus]